MRKYRILALLLACVIGLSSCSILKESGTMETPLTPQQPEYKGYLEYYASLYRISESTGQITGYTDTLYIVDWTNSPEEILEALLASPSEIGLGHIGSKIEVKSVTISDSVAYVQLEAGSYLTEKQQYYLASLTANALIDNCDVEHVEVKLNDRIITLAGLPTGLYGKQEGILEDAYQQQYDTIMSLEESQHYMVNGAMYFPHYREELILPEIFSVNVNVKEPLEMIRQVLWELSKGPRYRQGYQAPLRETVFTQMLSFYTVEELNNYLSYENGVLTIRHAEKLFSCSMMKDMDVRMACVFYTLQSVLPELQYLYCYWNDSLVLMDVQAAQRYLGDEISIYLPSEDMNSVQEVQRLVHSDEARELRSYIMLIGKGTQEEDPDTVVSVFPGSLTNEDLLSLEISGDCAILDFTEDFSKSMERLDTQGQVMVIYSIVNTLCTSDAISRVQFLVEGEAILKFEGSNLSLVSPLLPNPGLVKR